MKGRKPKSIERQISEGDPSKRGKGKLEQRQAAQPKATPGLPQCPRHLKGRARYAWNFLAAELEQMKIDKRPDALKLEGACRAYERAVKADLILDEEGLTVAEKFVDDSGEVIILKIRKHPAVDISKTSWALLRAFGSDFGLDPVARLRLTPQDGETPQDDDLSNLLSGSRKPRGPKVDYVQ